MATTLSPKKQRRKAWAIHDADTAHAEALAAEVASLESTAQVIADMERLDREAADERDAELLRRAKHPGNCVVHLN